MREANWTSNIHKHFRTTMKGKDHFKNIIKAYLDKRAQEDELFRAKYETTSRTIDDVVTYILNLVKELLLSDKNFYVFKKFLSDSNNSL